MKEGLKHFLRVELAPPRYLSMPTAGIDISASGIKVACLAERAHGLEMVAYGDEPLGTIERGEIVDPKPVVAALSTIAKKHNVTSANITLPEARSYLFETEAEGKRHSEWRTAVEQRRGRSSLAADR